ncbi:MAG: type II toxin-antitoxin system VapC family toxin [Parachlamydiaceae bacterium]|nr:type II toxin-antitoxin system VapC family toxin [Parachlamydiaceae bacterium]
MRPILFDTNAYASFKRNEVTIIEIVQRAELICMSPIVIGELVAGFDGCSKSKQNKIELQNFLESSRIIVYPITIDTSHFFSQVYCALKKKGKPIPTNDIWIASQALEHGCVVCTHDKHFGFIDGIISGSSVADLFL